MRTSSAGARIRALVALAADAVAPAWPLQTFVAVNPLIGFEDRSFAEATATAAALFRARTLPGAPPLEREPTDAGRAREVAALVDDLGVRDTLADWGSLLGWGDLTAELDSRCGRWLTAFCDRGEATVPMPHRERGFFAAWRRLARHEGGFVSASRAYRRALEALPEHADAALGANLDALEIPEPRRVGYLRRHLAQSSGWAGLVKQLAVDGAPIDLVALLAMRTWYERCAVGSAARRHGTVGTFTAIAAWLGADPTRLRALPARCGDSALHALALARLDDRERRFRTALLAAVAAAPTAPSRPPQAQVVFCIDVRSEPFRRRLERVGAIETFGFAGFFGVPFRFRRFDATESVAQAPVLLRPPVTVREELAPDDARALRLERERAAVAGAAFKGMLRDPFGAFAGVEVAGVGALLPTLRKTWRPSAREGGEPLRPLDLAVLNVDERAASAEAALRIMGLTRAFAPLVVLCGHGGSTVNNAFAAALDCGACGGNRGLVNARVAAAALNDRGVRTALASRGIEIPAGTWFAAAEHDTTRDVVRLLADDAPAEHAAALAALAAAFATAGAANRAEREHDLPAGPASADPFVRAADWAQPRPEWGLARNAALIVAPRGLTQGVDLQGRCFLHSYEPADDENGSALEQILTAPLVVAEWINLQYFFATVDPERFGSGDKFLQQPVAGIGVVAGNGGDLRPGLPLQSTSVGHTAQHEPLRLLALVAAPTARIDAIIARQSSVRRLFENGWVHLVALEADTGIARRYVGTGTWQLCDSEEVEACSQIA